MKAIICLLAAGALAFPVFGAAAPEQNVHAMTTAKEPPAGAAQRPKEDAALEEEMEDLGDVSLDGHDAGGKDIPAPEGKAADADAARSAGETPAQEQPAAHGEGQDTDSVKAPATDAHGSADDATAYGRVTAIDPVTLKNGDWVFIEGDERRGWFFDRAQMAKNADGSISYWQLILYNELGRMQFADAMHDEAYGDLAYTLQRRVLNLRDNTVRSYEIIAFGKDGAVLAESQRDGNPAAIHPDTMAEKERDAVKKAAKKLKLK